MIPGPCIFCGDVNYPLSMGGPEVCPACDCGSFHDHALVTRRMLHMAPPPTHNEREEKLAAEVENKFRPSLTSTDLYVDGRQVGVFDTGTLTFIDSEKT